VSNFNFDEDMEKKEKDSQVQAAKITAFQTIVVALITVAGGSVGYFFGDAGKAKSKPEIKQHWLIIKNVSSSGPVRIVIAANGINFSYPSQEVWFAGGAPAPQERFPLPAGSEKFKIAFTALTPGHDPQSLGAYETKNFHVEEIERKDVPTSDKTASALANTSLPLKNILEIRYAIE
jgi:hypothetical protein